MPESCNSREDTITYRIPCKLRIRRSWVNTGALVMLSLHAFGCHLPRNYTCTFSPDAPIIDGSLDEGPWQTASWTEDFVDIEGNSKPAPPLRTRAKLIWNNECLFIAAELMETHIWATLERHDDIVFHDNDFEVFIDPDGDGLNYVEVELNAFGTIFDLLLEKSYKNGGPAHHEWNVRDIQAAVGLDGTMNDPTDIDRRWVVELAIPWPAFQGLVNGPLPPHPGDNWKINFSRVEWPIHIDPGGYSKIAGQGEFNWVWSPQGVVDMHIPDRWGTLYFLAK